MPGPRSGRMTPPHLAQRELVYATPERADEFFAAIVRGFHDDYVAEMWEPHRRVIEFDRYSGKGVPDDRVSLSLRLAFRSVSYTHLTLPTKA